MRALIPLLLTTLALAPLLSTPCAATPSSADVAAAEEGLSLHGPRGLWLLKRPNGDIFELGQADPDRPRIPGSSFKPLLALIALQTGALAGADEVVPWDGRPYPGRERWQQPMALDVAMQSSSESYFRTLAERIGHDGLQRWVSAVGYGNARIGSDPSRAWVDGTLRISARQQLQFIERLRRGDLPFDAAHLRAVRKSMREEDGIGWYGKTGTSLPPAQAGCPENDDAGEIQDCALGWWIGWQDGPEGPHCFVLLLELDGFEGRQARLQIASALLAASIR